MSFITAQGRSTIAIYYKIIIVAEGVLDSVPHITKYLLRRTGMPGAVMVQISTREYDNSISQNISSNRRSTRLIPHITKH